MSKTWRHAHAADPLARFSEPTRTWFAAAFAEPTPAQVGRLGGDRARPARAGRGADRVRQDAERVPVEHRPAADQPSGRSDQTKRTRVLYVSPLKALAVDVERNLRSPAGRHPPHRRAAGRQGARRDRRRAVRRHPAADRRKLVTTPPDILITTPESLFLMLTSQARETLRGVETVIVDEVHAVAGTKRGAHLAISPRAPRRAARRSRRSGSGSARRCARSRRWRASSAATRPVEIVAPPSKKEWDLKVVVPVEDMTQPAMRTTSRGDDADDRAASRSGRTSRSHVVDLIEAAHAAPSSSPTPGGSASG